MPVARLRCGHWLMDVGGGPQGFNLVGQTFKPELGKQFPQPSVLQLPRAGLIPIHGQRQVVVQANQAFAQPGLIGEDFQVLFELRTGSFVGIRQNTFQVSKFQQQCARLLGAHQRHSGNVVDTVPHQRLKIDRLLGSNAPIRFQLVDTKKGVLPQVEHPDMGTK